MIVLFLLALPFIGWWVGVSVFDFLFKREDKNTYITHIHHYHDNRQLHITQQEETHHLD